MFVKINYNLKFLSSNNPDVAKRILLVAYPIIFANASRSIMGIVDMIMVGRLGVHSIAAVGFGELIIYSFIATIGFSLGIRIGNEYFHNFDGDNKLYVVYERVDLSPLLTIDITNPFSKKKD